MALLRSLLFVLLFYPGTLIYVLTVIAVSPIGDAPVQAVVHAWSKFHHWLVRHVLGIRIEWDGAIPDGPYLIAVKHQSMMEAVDTLHFAKSPVVVMKRELTVIPLFGWVTRRYGVIGVDRKAGASALRTMMAEARAAIAGGRPVIIFPEGTRVPYGNVAPIAARVSPVSTVRSGCRWCRSLTMSGGYGTRASSSAAGSSTSRSAKLFPPGLKRDDVEARVHTAINALTP